MLRKWGRFLSLTPGPEAAELSGARPSLEVRLAGTLRSAFGRLFRKDPTPCPGGLAPASIQPACEPTERKSAAKIPDAS
jgi:hypothetical protein